MAKAVVRHRIEHAVPIPARKRRPKDARDTGVVRRVVEAVKAGSIKTIHRLVGEELALVLSVDELTNIETHRRRIIRRVNAQLTESESGFQI